MPGCWTDARNATSRVAGLSMAPALLDGDQIRWEPSGSNLLPARLSRVVCQPPHEGVAVKRLIGFGGERVCCRSGELSIDGARVKKSPPQLAELATAVCGDPADWQPQSQWWQQIGDCWKSAGVPADQTAWLRFIPGGREGRPGGHGVFYDDSPWLEAERRRLEVVRDVGLAAVFEVKSLPGSTSEVVLQVGHQTARVGLRGGGRLACVAGLLDGRFVVAAWPLRGGADGVPLPADKLLGAGRQLFPVGLPDRWQQAVPIPEAAQPMPIQIGVRTLTETAGFTISRLLIWRDVQWLPHGVQACWEVPPGDVFLLGDCPAASRDSRQWGSLPAAAVIGRVVAAEGVNINPNESD